MSGRRRQRRRGYDLIMVTPLNQPHKSKACAAIGLGPLSMACELPAVSSYCYYHSKLAEQLLEPFEPEWYPVLPLPKFGYEIEVKEIVNGE